MAKALIVIAALIAAPALAHGPKPHGEVKPAHEGHGAEVGEPGDAKHVVRTFQIGMGDDMKFRPAVVTVRKGETIKFVVKNSGKLKHELVLGTPGLDELLMARARPDEYGPGWDADEPRRFGRWARRLWDDLLRHER